MCDATITRKSLFSPETLTNKRRSRSEMPSEKSVWQTLTDTPMPQSSAESLEQVDEGDPVSASVQTWRVEIRIPGVVVHDVDIGFALHGSGAKEQDSTNSEVHWTWIKRLECRQAVS